MNVARDARANLRQVPQRNLEVNPNRRIHNRAEGGFGVNPG